MIDYIDQRYEECDRAELTKELSRLRARVAERDEQIESVANMLRGMTMDPAIPAHAKEAMRAKIEQLEGESDE